MKQSSIYIYILISNNKKIQTLVLLLTSIAIYAYAAYVQLGRFQKVAPRYSIFCGLPLRLCLLQYNYSGLWAVLPRDQTLSSFRYKKTKKQDLLFFDQVTETLSFLLEPSFSSHAVHLTIYRNHEKGMAHY
jgi:hypothetical protein